MMALTVTETLSFETALGRCHVTWNDVGIVGVGLPDDADGQAVERAAVSGPPTPDFVRRAIAGMIAVLAGEAVDLSDVPLATKRRMLELEGAPGYGQLRLFRGSVAGT